MNENTRGKRFDVGLSHQGGTGVVWCAKEKLIIDANL